METFVGFLFMVAFVVGAYYLWYKPMEAYRKEQRSGASRPAESDKQDKQ